MGTKRQIFTTRDAAEFGGHEIERRPSYCFGVTHTETGTTNFPGAGLPTSTRSAVTSSPVSRLKDAQGFGMRPKVIFWIGWPVAVFMMVAMILIRGR
jgi:hypothetical protein